MSGANSNWCGSGFPRVIDAVIVTFYTAVVLAIITISETSRDAEEIERSFTGSPAGDTPPPG